MEATRRVCGGVLQPSARSVVDMYVHLEPGVVTTKLRSNGNWLRETGCAKQSKNSFTGRLSNMSGSTSQSCARTGRYSVCTMAVLFPVALVRAGRGASTDSLPRNGNADRRVFVSVFDLPTTSSQFLLLCCLWITEQISGCSTWTRTG